MNGVCVCRSEENIVKNRDVTEIRSCVTFGKQNSFRFFGTVLDISHSLRAIIWYSESSQSNAIATKQRQGNNRAGRGID